MNSLQQINQTQLKFYNEVRYFLFLIKNGQYYVKPNVNIKSFKDILHNNTGLNIPQNVSNFMIACENNQKVNYSENSIKQSLQDVFQMHNFFDWCDAFIHPFINLNELIVLSSNSKKYIMKHIFLEMYYRNKVQHNFNYDNDQNILLSFNEQIEVMEFFCKYGFHSEIGYVKKLTNTNKNILINNCVVIFDDEPIWVKKIDN